MRCPTCKKSDTFRAWDGPITLMGVEVLAHGQRCSSCGETLFDAAEVERQEGLVAAGLVERGVRTAAEFKLVRKSIGLRAVEVAELLGVRPETVSRWERGEVELPRAEAFVLGELYLHPKLTRQKLLALAS